MLRPSLARDCLLALLAFAIIAVLPYLVPSKGLTDFVVRLAAFGIFATSLNLLVGYGGMESFGHGLFFGLGAYSFGLLMQNFPHLTIPGVFALTYAGYFFAAESWAVNEHSSITASGPPIYPFKTILPLAGAFLLLQGLVEIVRCVICIQQGAWPSREHDVEEVDVGKLKEMVHVKDEDIEQLDRFVVPQGSIK